MSFLIPPPAPPADTRTPTQRSLYENTIGLIAAILNWGGKLYAGVWLQPDKTPAQALAELPDQSAGAFASYSALSTLVATEAAAIGADMSDLDPKKSGPISLPQIPAGYVINAPTDGKNVTLTLPPAVVPTAVAASIINGKATVTWSPVAGGLYYSIQRSEDGGATFQEVAGANSPNGSSNKSILSGGGQVVVTDATRWIDGDPMPAGTKYQISVTTPAGSSAYCAPVTLA